MPSTLAAGDADAADACVMPGWSAVAGGGGGEGGAVSTASAARTPNPGSRGAGEGNVHQHDSVEATYPRGLRACRAHSTSAATPPAAKRETSNNNNHYPPVTISAATTVRKNLASNYHDHPTATAMLTRHRRLQPQQPSPQPLPPQQHHFQNIPCTPTSPPTSTYVRVAPQAASSSMASRSSRALSIPRLSGPRVPVNPKHFARLSAEEALVQPSTLDDESATMRTACVLMLLPLLDVAMMTSSGCRNAAKTRPTLPRPVPRRWLRTGGLLLVFLVTTYISLTTQAAAAAVAVPQAQTLNDVATAVRECTHRENQQFCRIFIRTDDATQPLPTAMNPSDILPIQIPPSCHVLLLVDSTAATILQPQRESSTIVETDNARARGLFLVGDGGRLSVQQELASTFSVWQQAFFATQPARTLPRVLDITRRRLAVAQAPVAQVIALYESTCSIQHPPASDLRCWGRNNYGQLGQGDTTDRGESLWEMGSNLSAVDLGTGLTPRPNATTASPSYHSCHVLDPPGSVKCFGDNGLGQLGYGDTDDRGDDPGELGDALPAVDLGSSLPPILQLAQGGLHSCVLFAQTFQVKCWGYNFFGQLGYEDQDGRGDDAGEMGDLLPFVDIGTGLGAHELLQGRSHACARLNDTRQGGLKCWGFNAAGMLGYGDASHRGDGVGEMGDALPFVNVSSSGHVHVVQGDGGYSHTCILLNDSTVKCFGLGSVGRLGYGDTADRGDDPGEMGDSLPAVDVLGSATGVHVIRVQCGGYHSCALISDGSMKCWGYGANGQLGHENTTNIGAGAGETGDSLPMIQLGDQSVVSASLGGYHTCVRLNDSSVKCFGRNDYGQLGQGDMDSRGDNAGEMGSSLLVVNIGPVATFSPTSAPTAAPMPAPTAAPSTAPTSGPTPVPTTAPTPRPTLSLLAPVVQVLALFYSTCSIQAPPASDLRCWGRNNYGQLGQGDTTTLGDLKWQMGVNLSAVDLGVGLTPRPNTTTTGRSWHACYVLDPDGLVKCFGLGGNGQLGYEDTAGRGVSPGELGDALRVVDLGSSLPPILQLAQGGLHNCVLFVQHFRIKCWGYNLYGQLGYEDFDSRGDDAGEMGDSLPFVDLGTNLGAHELFVGFYHTCARLNDTRQGGLKCWGRNDLGQLGYGDTSHRGDDAGEMDDALPLVSLTASGNVHVAQGDGGLYHTCILLNDSAVKCFGAGGIGRLGYGDTADRGDDPGEMGDSLPAVDVLGSATGVHVIRVQCGGYHSCALISDGSMKCWGFGFWGQLGHENTTNIGAGAGEMGDSLPVIQLGDQSVVSASLGGYHTCVRLNDSSVKCFGRNDYGQIGQGDMDSRGDNAGEMGSSLPVVDIGPVVTIAPSPVPSGLPTPLPTNCPSPVPSLAPSLTPTPAPTVDTTSIPSAMPSQAPSVPPSPVPNTVPTPAPSTTPIATVLAENEVPQVQAVVQEADTIFVRWPAQSDPRMTVVGYRVAMQTAGAGSFETVSEPARNWTTVTGLGPATEFGFKIAVVATRGVGSLSGDTAWAKTWNDSVSFFEDRGVAVRVIASVPLPGCDASVILDASEHINTLFGTASPPCILINQRTARLQLEIGATLAPGTVVRLWTNETVVFSAPSHPTPVAPSLSSAGHVAWCGSWTADASSSTGVGGSVYPLSYRWWVSSAEPTNTASVTAENTRLASVSPSTNRVRFNATEFAQDSIVTVHVTVTSTVFNLSATTKADTNISAHTQPTVSIVGSANRSVLSFQDLAIRTSVSTPHCFSGLANSSVYRWWAVQGQMPASVTTSTATLAFPALSLDVTQTYVFRVRVTLEDFPVLPAVTADVQVSTLLVPPVVALSGGKQRTIPCEANTTLDASQSYDPNVCSIMEPCSSIQFMWSCIGCDNFAGAVEDATAAAFVLIPCDALNASSSAHFPHENATAQLQLDVSVFSTVTQLLTSDSVQLAVLGPSVVSGAAHVVRVDAVPGRLNGAGHLYVRTQQPANISLAILTDQEQDNDTSVAVNGSSASYFIVLTATLMPGLSYELTLSAATATATGPDAVGAAAMVSSVATSFLVNDPPVVGSLVATHTMPLGTEAVIGSLEVRTADHVDDPADLPLTLSFAWTDDASYTSTVLAGVAEFSLGDMAVPAGASIVVGADVADRLGAFSSVQTVVGSVLASDFYAKSVDWSRSGSIASALRSWAVFSSDLLDELLLDGENAALLTFEHLTLMPVLEPSREQAQAIMAMAPARFGAVTADVLTTSICESANAIATLNGVNSVDALLFLAQVSESGCGSDVFVLASASTQTEYVSVYSSFSTGVSGSRAGVESGTELSTSTGVSVRLDQGVTAGLSRTAEFADMHTASVPPDTAAFSSANIHVQSAVHNVELRPSALPNPGLCNVWEGRADGACVAQDEVVDTSNLGKGAVTVVLAVNESVVQHGYADVKSLVCAYASLESLAGIAAANDDDDDDDDDDAVSNAGPEWETEGCELVSATTDSVTCVCDHLTAFAVGSLVQEDGNKGHTHCTHLSSSWNAAYGSCAYLVWLVALSAAWVFVGVTDAAWLFADKTKCQRKEFSELVFITRTVIVCAVLRLLYNALLVLAFFTSRNMACAELGLRGSGSVIPSHTLFVVHDIFYPVLFTLCSSVFLYWLDLADVLETNMGRAQHMRFMKERTLRRLIAFNVVFLVYSAIMDTYLAVSASEQHGLEVRTTVVAQTHLAITAGVAIVEALFFLYGCTVLERSSSDGVPLRKIRYMSLALCGLFLLLAGLLLILSIPDTLNNVHAALFLYSVLLPVVELAMVTFLYRTMHKKLGNSSWRGVSVLSVLFGKATRGWRSQAMNFVRRRSSMLPARRHGPGWVPTDAAGHMAEREVVASEHRDKRGPALPDALAKPPKPIGRPGVDHPRPRQEVRFASAKPELVGSGSGRDRADAHWKRESVPESLSASTHKTAAPRGTNPFASHFLPGGPGGDDRTEEKQTAKADCGDGVMSFDESKSQRSDAPSFDSPGASRNDGSSGGGSGGNGKKSVMEPLRGMWKPRKRNRETNPFASGFVDPASGPAQPHAHLPAETRTPAAAPPPAAAVADADTARTGTSSGTLTNGSVVRHGQVSLSAGPGSHWQDSVTAMSGSTVRHGQVGLSSVVSSTQMASSMGTGSRHHDHNPASANNGTIHDRDGARSRHTFSSPVLSLSLSPASPQDYV